LGRHIFAICAIRCQALLIVTSSLFSRRQTCFSDARPLVNGPHPSIMFLFFMAWMSLEARAPPGRDQSLHFCRRGERTPRFGRLGRVFSFHLRRPRSDRFKHDSPRRRCADRSAPQPERAFTYSRFASPLEFWTRLWMASALLSCPPCLLCCFTYGGQPGVTWTHARRRSAAAYRFQ